MPRRVTEEKLEKVISTKITTKKYELLEKYARELYIQKKIKQPTVSVLLRTLINVWLGKTESIYSQNNTHTNSSTAKASKSIEPVHDFSRMMQSISKIKQG